MAQARYDAVADFYVSGFDSVSDPASVALLELVGPVVGLRVLDVACGHGRITRELARHGADVTGIDISGVLIAKARQTEQNEPLGIRYIHADVAARASLGDDPFDLVVCNFGLSDIDDLDTGRPRTPSQHSAARSGRTTGCCRPTSARSGATVCGSTRSPNRHRSQTGTRPTMPTASPYSWWPGPSSRPDLT